MSAREEADLQVRRRLRDLNAICSLSKVHAISAMGTKLCFYTGEAGRAITPPRIVADDQLATGTLHWGVGIVMYWRPRERLTSRPSFIRYIKCAISLTPVSAQIFWIFSWISHATRWESSWCMTTHDKRPLGALHSVQARWELCRHRISLFHCSCYFSIWK